MQKTLVALMRHTDIRVIYAVMVVFYLPFYFLTRPSAVQAQYRYFRERLSFSRVKAIRGTWTNFYNFGQVVLDRFAAHAGKRYRYIVEDKNLFYDLVSEPQGFMVFSSHLGYFEMAGYELTTPLKKMNVVLYAGDTQVVMENRKRLLAEHNIHLIPLQPDLSHVYAINNALSNGEIVAMPADRRIGDSKSVAVPVLGKEAKLPMGPFAIAVTRNEIVRVVFVVKEKWDTYHIFIRPLAVPSEGTTRQRIRDLAAGYAGLLTDMAKRYPTQLYNYYDFWADKTWL